MGVHGSCEAKLQLKGCRGAGDPHGFAEAVSVTDVRHQVQRSVALDEPAEFEAGLIVSFQ